MAIQPCMELIPIKKKINEGLFASYFQNNNLQTLGKADLNEVNFSFSKFILKINEPVDVHALFKNLKPKMKKHHKP